MEQLPLEFEVNPDHQAAFETFHAAHPEVWRLFERFALEALRSDGSRRIGARMVWERIRWESRVAVDLPGDKPKLNDHHVPYYARLFLQTHSHLGPVFETRALGRR